MQNNIPEAVHEYLSAYRYKIELHAHTTPGSSCSEIPPKDMIRLMKEQHYDAVIITNHFYAGGQFMKSEDPVETYLADFYAAREEGKKNGIQVLLGAEYRFDENMNDYLVYGVDESFLRETVTCFDMGIEAFYKEYHRESLLILQAHPFRNGCTPARPECLDGIETMNLHPNHNSRVAVASRYAKNWGSLNWNSQNWSSQNWNSPIVTIGTDLHHWGHEGVSALRTKVLPETESQLVEILRSKDYIFEVGGCPMLPYFSL
ncbi:MAG: PHP domain-containing protein [Roseburia sp.]|nr:PHP domain-containing protein [Roseburia sp.]